MHIGGDFVIDTPNHGIEFKITDIVLIYQKITILNMFLYLYCDLRWRSIKFS